MSHDTDVLVVAGGSVGLLKPSAQREAGSRNVAAHALVGSLAADIPPPRETADTRAGAARGGAMDGDRRPEPRSPGRT